MNKFQKFLPIMFIKHQYRFLTVDSFLPNSPNDFEEKEMNIFILLKRNFTWEMLQHIREKTDAFPISFFIIKVHQYQSVEEVCLCDVLFEEKNCKCIYIYMHIRVY